MASSSGKSNNTKKAPAKNRSASAAGKKKNTNSKSASKAEAAQRSDLQVRRSARDERDEYRSDAWEEQRYNIYCQIMPFALICLSVLILVFYILSDRAGFVGSGIRTVLSGLFSGAGLCFPILLFITAVYWRRDHEKKMVRVKLLLSLLFMLLLAVLLHVWATRASGRWAEASELLDIRTHWTNGVALKGGGAFGGMLGALMVRAFGRVGTVIIAAVILFCTGLLIFGLTPHSLRIWISYRIHEHRERRAEELEAARAEIEAEEALRHRQLNAGYRVTHQTGSNGEAIPDRTQVPAEPKVTITPAGRRKGKVDIGKYAVPSGTGTGSGVFGEKIEEMLTDLSDGRKVMAAEDKKTAQADNAVETDITAARVGDEIIIAPEDMRPETEAEEGKLIDETLLSSVPAYSSRNTDSSSGAQSISDELQTSGEDTVDLTDTAAGRTVQPSGGVILTEMDDDDTADTEPGNNDLPPFDTAEADSYSQASAPRRITGSGTRRGTVSALAKEPPADEDENESVIPAELLASVTAKRSSESTAVEAVTAAELEPAPAPKKEYRLPPAQLLKIENPAANEDVSEELQTTAKKLVDTLKSFKVHTKIVNISRGPTITRYELLPDEGVRIRSIANLVDDIALNLAATGVRIEAPIPNKSAVGVEVPNRVVSTVWLRELIENPKFGEAASKLTVGLGMDVAGEAVYLNIAKMPHLLIAGATGMGKSVCINSMIVSLLCKATPAEVRMILVDPKKVELSIYNGLPHLLVPVVSDPKKAAGALYWAVTEMERRFQLFEESNSRNLAQYNQYVSSQLDELELNPDLGFETDALTGEVIELPRPERLPEIVIIIDELADLMMTAPDDVEDNICRLAQKARAAGMHLIIGTQRPSVDVITGLIKANIPSRISFRTASQTDSRVILDTVGAEKLIGRGDMLCQPVGATKPMRVQGAYVSEGEIEQIIKFICDQSSGIGYDDSIIEDIERAAEQCGVTGIGKKGSPGSDAGNNVLDDNSDDVMLKQAIKLAVESGKISTSLIQRKLSLGYGRAAKLIDRMEEMGIVSGPDNQKPRNVLISNQEYMEMVLNNTI